MKAHACPSLTESSLTENRYYCSSEHWQACPAHAHGCEGRSGPCLPVGEVGQNRTAEVNELTAIVVVVVIVGGPSLACKQKQGVLTLTVHSVQLLNKVLPCKLSMVVHTPCPVKVTCRHCLLRLLEGKLSACWQGPLTLNSTMCSLYLALISRDMEVPVLLLSTALALTAWRRMPSYQTICIARANPYHAEKKSQDRLNHQRTPSPDIP